jgi:methionine biosynthesis protein MetW
MSDRKHDYDFQLALTNPSSTHSIQVGMIAPGSRVLDIGCHSGILGGYLRTNKSCYVVGIDTDANALSDASERLNKAWVGNVELAGWSDLVRGHEQKPFDVILFGDVLEHTRDPLSILKEARSLLKPDGQVIVSIPNVAHWRIRLGLVAGKFEYTESGILDRTHLRFYTHRSATELLRAAGYRIVADDAGGYHLPHWLIRSFRKLLAVQFVLACKAN